MKKNTSPELALGESVRRARQAREISQEQLAFETGLHRTYIGSIERGERNVSLKNIVLIANALGMTASELLDHAGL